MRLTYQAFTDDYSNWIDWKWQLSHSIDYPAQLEKYMDTEGIAECVQRFPMKITPYYLSLIDWADPNDPIKAQAIPSIQELQVDECEKDDPLAEESMSPVRTIVHRYPDRVLFTVSSCCAMYCRHCTRKRWAGHLPIPFSNDEILQGIDYIRNHTKVRDVVISGGDPMLLNDKYILEILDALHDIPHIEMVRIGTRTPVTLPMRWTKELVYQMEKYYKLWINVHFNHVNEITDLSESAIRLIQSVGIPVNNQSVLLKGVNDTIEDMRNLVKGLTKMRVRPYYLYQCDLAKGLKHFRTDPYIGVKIIRGLRGYISGLCIPQFVIDAPNGGGKVPIDPNYVTYETEEFIEFKNYRGMYYSYPKG